MRCVWQYVGKTVKSLLFGLESYSVKIIAIKGNISFFIEQMDLSHDHARFTRNNRIWLPLFQGTNECEEGKTSEF